MNQVRYVPIEEIIVTNPYLRLDTKIEELKKSIKAVGLIHPLIINQDNELIAGGRRYSALRSLGYEEIPVVVVEHGHMEQELISIDENLMRLPLTHMEMERALNRGREIYETIHPTAKKVEVSPEMLIRKPPKRAPAQDEPEEVIDPVDGEASFVEVTARKTGLSEGAIRSAIIRDQRASETLKEIREQGEFGASQTNELVKLEMEEQDKLLPVVSGKSTKEIRQIVKDVQEHGLDETIEKLMQAEPIPKEYEQSLVLMGRLQKLLGRCLRKEIKCTGQGTTEFLDATGRLIERLDAILEFNPDPYDVEGQVSEAEEAYQAGAEAEAEAAVQEPSQAALL